MVSKKKSLAQLQAELRRLQAALSEALKKEGKDQNIEVKVQKNQARSDVVKQKVGEDKKLAKFYLEILLTAKGGDVYVPISVASGKKTAGFMYRIEGTAIGSIVETSVKVRGEKISHVTLGTLLYAKIPAGKTALFQIQATTRGKSRETYGIVLFRLNYKLELNAQRYQQYLKEIVSDTVKLP
jgi:hypothetical protein